MTDTEDEEIYIYLDFNEKLASSIFQNKFFLRIANLHKTNPLVQLNDLIFKGTYDESIGTNMFFEEIENPLLKTNVFEKETPIRLKYYLAQTKVMKLKQIKLPKKVSMKNPQEFVNINLKQDYKKTLDKLEQGTLNIEDLIQHEQDTDAVPPEQNEEENEKEMNTKITEFTEEPTESNNEVAELSSTLTEEKSDSTLLMEKYEKLKELARIPVKRLMSSEDIADISNTDEADNTENKSFVDENYFKYNYCAMDDLTLDSSQLQIKKMP